MSKNRLSASPITSPINDTNKSDNRTNYKMTSHISGLSSNRPNQRLDSTNLTQMGKNNSGSNIFENEDKIKSISEAEFSFDKGSREESKN